jgi:predicted transcriptional regulator
MIHRTTFALDENTARRLKRLAARWQVSQAEVVRRSVEKAEQSEISEATGQDRVEAARRLRATLQDRKIDVKNWIRTARESRR